jgi:hypothetical protein
LGTLITKYCLVGCEWTPDGVETHGGGQDSVFPGAARMTSMVGQTSSSIEQLCSTDEGGIGRPSFE